MPDKDLHGFSPRDIEFLTHHAQESFGPDDFDSEVESHLSPQLSFGMAEQEQKADISALAQGEKPMTPEKLSPAGSPAQQSPEASTETIQKAAGIPSDASLVKRLAKPPPVPESPGTTRPRRPPRRGYPAPAKGSLAQQLNTIPEVPGPGD